MRKTLILFSCAILCSSFAGAQSTESVCDGEEGAAFGLCNAFCEAMDCDTDNPEASATACDKVKSKFQQITGNEPPCLAPVVTCPCFALPGFLAAADSAILGCSTSSAYLLYLNTVQGQFVIYPDSCSFGGSLTITLDEAVVCRDFLAAKVAAAGGTCDYYEPY
jgi:hypothetical protein